MRLSDVQSPRKDVRELIVVKESNGIKLLSDRNKQVWEIEGFLKRYQYKSSKWAENRYNKIVRIKERD